MWGQGFNFGVIAGAAPLDIDFLVLAGGAAGGANWSTTNTSYPSGGGGAGGLRTSYGSTSGGGAAAQSQFQLLAGINPVVNGLYRSLYPTE